MGGHIWMVVVWCTTLKTPSNEFNWSMSELDQVGPQHTYDSYMVGNMERYLWKLYKDGLFYPMRGHIHTWAHASHGIWKSHLWVMYWHTFTWSLYSMRGYIHRHTFRILKFILSTHILWWGKLKAMAWANGFGFPAFWARPKQCLGCDFGLAWPGPWFEAGPCTSLMVRHLQNNKWVDKWQHVASANAPVRNSCSILAA